MTDMTCILQKGLRLLKCLRFNLKSVPDRVFMSILRGRCGTVKLSPSCEFNTVN